MRPTWHMWVVGSHWPKRVEVFRATDHYVQDVVTGRRYRLHSRVFFTEFAAWCRWQGDMDHDRQSNYIFRNQLDALHRCTASSLRGRAWYCVFKPTPQFKRYAYSVGYVSSTERPYDLFCRLAGYPTHRAHA